jgi:hypothetical protein
MAGPNGSEDFNLSRLEIPYASQPFFRWRNVKSRGNESPPRTECDGLHDARRRKAGELSHRSVPIERD